MKVFIASKIQILSHLNLSLLSNPVSEYLSVRCVHLDTTVKCGVFCNVVQCIYISVQDTRDFKKK